MRIADVANMFIMVIQQRLSSEFSLVFLNNT